MRQLLAIALIFVLSVAAIFLLTRTMRRISLRAQFMVLLGLGVLIGFIFLTIVQVPGFPFWVGVSLIVFVFAASLFGVRIFLRSLAQDRDGF